MDTDKQIDRRFKILYAVGVVLMCCGHTSGSGISLFRDWFPYSGYHLALFFSAPVIFTGVLPKRKLPDMYIRNLKL